jgi:hypothetical protein
MLATATATATATAVVVAIRGARAVGEEPVAS